MGWAVGWDYRLRRDIGYGVPAICDDPSCDAEIDRGLSYCCGQKPFGGEKGCGLHFCGSHLWSARGTLVCRRCKSYRSPYEPKPDTDEWVQHKLTDPTWAEWRDDNFEWVAEHAPKIEARRAETQSGSVEDESLVPAGQAPDPLTPDAPAPTE